MSIIRSYQGLRSANKEQSPHAKRLSRFTNAVMMGDPYANLDPLVDLCVRSIAKGELCEVADTPDFAMASFLNARWADDSQGVLEPMFAKYVEAGFIKLDEPIRARAGGNYEAMAGARPIELAVEAGKTGLVKAMVLHGAKVSDVDGHDFFQWAIDRIFVRRNLGQPPLDERIEAVATFKHALMTRTINTRASAEAAPSPPRRSRRL